MKNKKVILTAILVVIIASIIGHSIFLENRSSEILYLQLNLRSRVETFEDNGVWTEVQIQKKFIVNETAILIIDMWDKHWCSGATKRIEAMAPLMNSVVEVARKNGVQIIHAPSETMDYYENNPCRKIMKNFTVLDLPELSNLTEIPLLPVDDSDGGCDTGDSFYKAWKRQHPSIKIKHEDVISDDINEIYSYLKQKEIKNIIIMGVHANECIIDRPVGIKKMLQLGFNAILVRDLTDAMYNPEMPPHISHDEGVELVIQYIEKYLCPTILSKELISIQPD